MSENRDTENQVITISTEEEMTEIFAKIFEDAFQAQNPEGKSLQKKPTPTQTWCWWGGSLKNRPCYGTYQRYGYSKVPPNITIPPELAEIKTLMNLKTALSKLENNKDMRMLFKSPTACYFDISETDPGLFYRDQQDCVLWYLDERTGYVMDQQGNYVAKSLPEFLARIRLENATWYKQNSSYGNVIKFSPPLKREIQAYEQFYENNPVRS